MSYLQYYFYALSADSNKKPLLEQQHVDSSERGQITCGCGQVRALTMAFRCLYCGEWFCFKCAEIHFGQTVNDWRSEKRITLAKELSGLSTDQICERIRTRKRHATEA